MKRKYCDSPLQNPEILKIIQQLIEVDKNIAIINERNMRI